MHRQHMCANATYCVYCAMKLQDKVNCAAVVVVVNSCAMCAIFIEWFISFSILLDVVHSRCSSTLSQSENPMPDLSTLIHISWKWTSRGRERKNGMEQKWAKNRRQMKHKKYSNAQIKWTGHSHVRMCTRSDPSIIPIEIDVEASRMQ